MATVLNLKQIEANIRNIPDFPKEGILFKDITPLLLDSAVFRAAIDHFADHYRAANIDLVVGIESRGFIFGAPLAYQLQTSFAPARKSGKLPARTVQAEYTLEYGNDTIEMHCDAILPGQRVLIIDDVLATGGTALAAVKLVEQLQGEVAGVAFLAELTFLNGRGQLKPHSIFSLIQY